MIVIILMAVNVLIESMRFYFFSMVEKYRVETTVDSRPIDHYSVITFLILFALDFFNVAGGVGFCQKCIETIYAVLFIYITLSGSCDQGRNNKGNAKIVRQEEGAKEVLLIEEHKSENDNQN